MDGDFQRYLAPHESVRWTGKPAQGLLFRASDALMVPFTLLWCGFAIFWEAGASASGLTMFSLWGVPFVLVGLYMVVGRFFYDAWLRSRTSYALTDRRALILSGAFEQKLTSVELSTLTELHYKPGSGGQGTIVFGPEAPLPAGMTFGRRYGVASPEFFKVDNADGAYAMIQRQRQPA